MLAIQIFKYLLERSALEQSIGSGVVGFSLADMRRKYNLPRSTFHTAICHAIDSTLIERIGRDRYVLTHSFLLLAVDVTDSGDNSYVQ